MQTIIAVLVLILLFGAVLLRHELRHRQDKELLESRVKERTAELEAALAERSVMLHEIHHRVKNNLQVIISMLRLEVERQGDVAARASLETSIQRIFAMSLVHETLYNTKRLDDLDLSSYAKGLLETMRNASPVIYDFASDGPIPVGLDFAVPFGLLLNELVSNAERHAFPSGYQGRVEIRIESREGLVLSVSDNGVGIAEAVRVEEAKTLGLTLVKALVEQLRGEYSLERRPGTRWTFRFPPKDSPAPPASPLAP